MTHTIRLLPLTVLLACAASPAGAQEIAGTFEQLRVLVKPGDRITVIDDAGRETTGSIADLSASSLVLLSGRDRHDFSASDIGTIRQRRSDSLANGAKWGLAVGAGLGLLAGLALASEAGDAGAFVVGATLFYGGVGAGIGVGVDALISGNQVIYVRRSSPSARFTVTSPMTPRRLGIVVTLGL